MSGVTDLDTTDPQPSANGPTVNRRDDAILAVAPGPAPYRAQDPVRTQRACKAAGHGMNIESSQGPAEHARARIRAEPGFRPDAGPRAEYSTM